MARLYTMGSAWQTDLPQHYVPPIRRGFITLTADTLEFPVLTGLSLREFTTQTCRAFTPATTLEIGEVRVGFLKELLDTH